MWPITGFGRLSHNFAEKNRFVRQKGPSSKREKLTQASKSRTSPDETTAERSRVMRAVKGSDTRPELKIRKLLHRKGLRFRLGGCGLPGKPDIVLPRWGTAIFVHGCFWHGHKCARGARTPKANREYWIGKISRNVARDERVRNELTVLGWRVLVVWECEIGEMEALEAKFQDAFQKSEMPAHPCAPRAEERERGN